MLSFRLPRIALSLRHALVGLLLAIAVLFGGVEASACASDPIVAAAVEAAATNNGDAPLQNDADPNGEHKACGHGHCHHGQYATPERIAAPASLVAEQVISFPIEICRPGADPTRLKRPPRI